MISVPAHDCNVRGYALDIASFVASAAEGSLGRRFGAGSVVVKREGRARHVV